MHSSERYVSTCTSVCPRKILPPHLSQPISLSGYLGKTQNRYKTALNVCCTNVFRATSAETQATPTPAARSDIYMTPKGHMPLSQCRHRDKQQTHKAASRVETQTLNPLRPEELTQPGLAPFPSGWSILLHKKNTTHRQLVSLRSNKVKCTDCCLRRGWLDYDATSPPFHSFRLGEGEPDRNPVNKTKKGGSDSKFNSHQLDANLLRVRHVQTRYANWSRGSQSSNLL